MRTVIKKTSQALRSLAFWQKMLILRVLTGIFILADVLTGASHQISWLIISNFRLPRLLILVIAGVAISVSGGLVQDTTENPLADSSLIGVTAGSSFGIVLFIAFGASLSNVLYVYPIFAVAGALLAYAILYQLALKRNSGQVNLILTGLAISAVFQALITIVQLHLDQFGIQKLAVWLSGDVWLTDYPYIALLAVLLAFALIILPRFFRRIDLLQTGQEMASSLGLDVIKTQKQLLILSLLFAAIGVAAVGSLGFLGLLAPHIARNMTTFSAKKRYIITIFVGVLIMLISDMLARTLIAPSTLPIGFVLSIVGAPYFIYLITKKI
ncbi:FecCD family ABC transporter permease [Lactococcus insecticola]|uniref:Ferrichrome ABC transporter permease n=1 Tax=Pseudolactococcus insecticola TaxID=2709158 RepID=A0A6A0B7V3_9LACT|nr:iron ABC transporter permease [Lactococcus insecticola]GFH40548.1 ferrichrome ABC transporter permease [Lactococcus insecticola]